MFALVTSSQKMGEERIKDFFEDVLIGQIKE